MEWLPRWAKLPLTARMLTRYNTHCVVYADQYASIDLVWRCFLHTTIGVQLKDVLSGIIQTEVMWELDNSTNPLLGNTFCSWKREQHFSTKVCAHFDTWCHLCIFQSCQNSMTGGKNSFSCKETKLGCFAKMPYNILINYHLQYINYHYNWPKVCSWIRGHPMQIKIVRSRSLWHCFFYFRGKQSWSHIDLMGNSSFSPCSCPLAQLLEPRSLLWSWPIALKLGYQRWEHV